MKKVDIILGCFVLVPILCLIIPVPLVLLDILFTLNIAISMIVLFSCLPKNLWICQPFLPFCF